MSQMGAWSPSVVLLACNAIKCLLAQKMLQLFLPNVISYILRSSYPSVRLGHFGQRRQCIFSFYHCSIHKLWLILSIGDYHLRIMKEVTSQCRARTMLSISFMTYQTLMRPKWNHLSCHIREFWLVIWPLGGLLKALQIATWDLSSRYAHRYFFQVFLLFTDII